MKININNRMRISLRLMADKLFGKSNPILVGRWNIDYDNTIQERKVYLTNMDHCGCCGSIKTKSIQNKNSENAVRLPKKTSRIMASKHMK
jgi:hypothetical protein